MENIMDNFFRLEIEAVSANLKANEAEGSWEGVIYARAYLDALSAAQAVWEEYNQ